MTPQTIFNYEIALPDYTDNVEGQVYHQFKRFVGNADNYRAVWRFVGVGGSSREDDFLSVVTLRGLEIIDA